MTALKQRPAGHLIDAAVLVGLALVGAATPSASAGRGSGCRWSAGTPG
ncbi:MAG TPA: hypothetical protein VES42_04840 [Pilimelia sp.]|nr:hypothetical protein [Pilimelia sp.]